MLKHVIPLSIMDTPSDMVLAPRRPLGLITDYWLLRDTLFYFRSSDKGIWF
jgi:hypothetical protein